MEKIKIHLTQREIKFLESKGKEKLTKRKRDRVEILLLCHRGKSEKDISDFLRVSTDTLWRVKKRYNEGGAEYAIEEKKRPGQPKRYDTGHETELTALACSSTPEGRERWTLALLTEQMRYGVKGCEDISRETVRLMLKKTAINLGSRRCGA